VRHKGCFTLLGFISSIAVSWSLRAKSIHFDQHPAEVLAFPVSRVFAFSCATEVVCICISTRRVEATGMVE